MLNRYDVRCDLAKCGTHAVDKVKQKYLQEVATYDLIIMDVNVEDNDNSLKTTQAIR